MRDSSKPTKTIDTEIVFGGRLPRRPIKKRDVVERAMEIYTMIDGFTYTELEQAIQEVLSSENPNKAHLELLRNVRDYKRIVDKIETI